MSNLASADATTALERLVSQYETWIADDLVRIEAAMDAALARAAIAPAQIDRVFLTGGSSLIPAIRAIFNRRFGDARIATNNQRVQARDWLLPLLRQHMEAFTAAEISAVFERAGLPYAPITKPQDLFDDEHLLATGGLADVTLPADASGAGQPVATRTALLPP